MLLAVVEHIVALCLQYDLVRCVPADDRDPAFLCLNQIVAGLRAFLQCIPEGIRAHARQNPAAGQDVSGALACGEAAFNHTDLSAGHALSVVLSLHIGGSQHNSARRDLQGSGLSLDHELIRHIISVRVGDNRRSDDRYFIRSGICRSRFRAQSADPVKNAVQLEGIRLQTRDTLHFSVIDALPAVRLHAQQILRVAVRHGQRSEYSADPVILRTGSVLQCVGKAVLTFTDDHPASGHVVIRSLAFGKAVSGDCNFVVGQCPAVVGM